MILWTIQSLPAWEELQRHGLLQTDPRCVDNNFLPAYRWIADQMGLRLGCRTSLESLPLWAWYQWQDEEKPKPDLRSRGHLPKGQKGVRITFEHSEESVLLSDFDLWHYILNYWYLPASLEDGEAFEAELAGHGLSFFESKPLSNPVYHKHIQDSWERIFNLSWTEEDLSLPFPQKSVQGTFWELRIDQVKEVKVFTAR